jgi:hypothetical protein
MINPTYLYLVLLIFMSCTNRDRSFQIQFYEHEKKIATIENKDILQADWLNFKFRITKIKIEELKSIAINGVSPTYAIFISEKDTSVKVGVCSTVSSNCFSKNRSTFWFNNKTGTLFKGDTLILYPPIDGQFEKGLINFSE